MSGSTTTLTERGNAWAVPVPHPTMEERRLKPRAARYPIESHVSVRRASGESFIANSVNISSSGILLNLKQPFHFEIGEELTLELDLPAQSDKPLSIWGYGKVVRVDEEHFAVQLAAGSFFDVRGGPHAGSD